MHEEPEFVRRITASYQFNVTLNGKYVTTWSESPPIISPVCVWLNYLLAAENKTSPQGAVYNEAYKNGKPDCLVIVEDDDLVKLMFGKLNPQRVISHSCESPISLINFILQLVKAFMLGKLKVKGNIMLLQKLNSLWLELQKSGKTPEMPYLIDLITKTVINDSFVEGWH